MDIFVFDNVKAEKLKALLSYNLLQTISNLFRLVEICLALLLLSWISARLPFLLRISADYLRRLLEILLSPLFIFLLSNLIVVTLLAKSGRLTDGDQIAPLTLPPTDLYENLIGDDKIDIKPDEIVKEINTEWEVETEIGNLEVKVLRRSKSEKVKEAEKPKLRRSETEMNRKETEAVEELSTEEFNRTVEEFIAKQMRFHLEEKVAIVRMPEEEETSSSGRECERIHFPLPQEFTHSRPRTSGCS